MDYDARRPHPNGVRVASNDASSVQSQEQARSQGSIMSGAEKYEDDKRRITSSCFSKKDEKGVLLQTYITHIRVEEDALYPTEPPLPSSDPKHKKQRAIIAAVKSSGKVMVHKARENADGTFQIGKSWPMEDLHTIEIFSVAQASTQEERQRAENAGPSGFSITMQKPYFWKANSEREKDFFVQSLVKIYRKYTRGNIPYLVGFDELQKAHILGTTTPVIAQTATPATSATHESDSLRPPRSIAAIDRRPESSGSAEPSMRSGSLTSSLGHRPPSPLRARNAAASPYRTPPATQDFTVAALSPTKPLQSRQSRDVSQPRALEYPQRERLQSPGGYAQRVSPQPSSGPPSDRGQHGQHDGAHSAESATLTTSTAERWRSEASAQRRPQEANLGASDAVVTERPAAEAIASPEAPPQALPERRRPPLHESAYGPTRSLRSADEPKPLMPRGPRPDAAVRATARPAEPSPEHLDSQIPGAFVSPSPSPAPAIRGAPETAPSRPAQGDQSAVVSPVPSSRVESPPPVQNEAAAEEMNPDGTPKFRPGLGPMTGTRSMTSSEVANKFRKAANAANAFKPRAGGAGARLFAKKDQKDGEGVTNVFKAPQRTKTAVTDESISNTPVDKVAPILPETETIQEQPRVEVTSPTSPAESAALNGVVEQAEDSEERERELAINSQKIAAERKARKRRSDMYAKCFAMLQIDPAILRGQDKDFQDILADFGWDQNILQAKKFDVMETDLRREISRLEAGAWLGHADSKDNRVGNLDKMLDKAIAECDEMEGLLTLYSVELNTLNDDVQFIENQSHGLQVQTANQKLLHNELQNLISTVSIGADQMQPLRRASVADSRGLESIETCLVTLHKALNTIDPQALRGRAVISANRFAPKTNFTNMRALEDKKEMYIDEVLAFIEKLKNHMNSAFAAAFLETQDAIHRRSSGTRDAKSSDVADHDLARRALWRFMPLMLFTRDVDLGAWNDMISLYQDRARPIFQEELRDSIASWKNTARKPTKEEQAAIFSAQEGEAQSLTNAARKLTIKRSQTLMSKSFRSGSLEKKQTLDKTQSNKLWSFETFAGTLEELIPLMSTEQNFIIDFFSASTLAELDFVDSVNLAPPDVRRLPNLSLKKPVDRDRKMAITVTSAMEQVFASWPAEMQSLIEWTVSSNELNIVGVLCAIERARIALEDSNQEFISSHLLSLQTRFTAHLTRFIDDQIRAIEDTKVKTKKRKGVISFMRVFPNFVELVEGMLPPADSAERLETRALVADAYARINKAMFDSLKFIARDSPSGPGGGAAAAAAAAAAGAGVGASADPDDKEALNYHILLIENMHHYVHEVAERGDPVLAEWKARAAFEMSEHRALYLNAVVRRPLGKLLDFVESTESLMASSPHGNPAQIPLTHPSHSRSTFKKVLAAHAPKDVRRGVEALRARVDKHFTAGGNDSGGGGAAADEPAVSQKLVAGVLAEAEARYVDAVERVRRIGEVVYERSVEVELRAADVQAAFRR